MELRVRQPELEKFIDEKVRAGQFVSADAVVEDALRRMMEAERAPLATDDLEEIAQADAEIDRAEFVEFTTFAAQTKADKST